MNELITRVIEENLPRYLADIPKELLNDCEIELVTYIVDYYRSYGGSLPSLKLLMEEFEDFMPFEFTPSKWARTPEPIEAVYDRTMKEALLGVSEALLMQAESELRRDNIVPLEKLNEIQRLHTLATGALKYSTFDRSLYFRKGKLDIPFKLINKQIGRLADGDFMLMVGRLGTGKSTLAQWFAKYAWEMGKKILYVSAEMLGADVFARIDGMVGSFNPLRLRGEEDKAIRGELDDVMRLASSAEGEIIIPKQRLLTPSEITGFAKNLNADLIIVDGMYLLNADGFRGGSRWENVAGVSNQIKQMALDLQIPVVGTAQIKRGASGEDGFSTEDIALSDALGQDADFVLAIHPNAVVVGRNELQLIKNRYGERIATQIFIDFERMLILDESIDGEMGKAEIIKIEEWVK